MRFTRPNSGVVEVDATPLKVLRDHRQVRSTDCEAGGILLGRLIRDASDVVIDHATSPSAADRRGRFSFFRAQRPAQIAVDDAWAASDCSLNYVGEWHTHPEDSPNPSFTDRLNWMQIVRRAKFEQDFLLFMIVGRIDIRVWELQRRGFILRTLDVILDHNLDSERNSSQ